MSTATSPRPKRRHASAARAHLRPGAAGRPRVQLHLGEGASPQRGLEHGRAATSAVRLVQHAYEQRGGGGRPTALQRLLRASAAARAANPSLDLAPGGPGAGGRLLRHKLEQRL